MEIYKVGGLVLQHPVLQAVAKAKLHNGVCMARPWA